MTVQKIGQHGDQELTKPKKQFWIWVDGQKRYYDYPAEPPGYTLEQLQEMEWATLLSAHQKDK